jgi:F-type H+-transporting ATPase subunit alpha
MKEHPENLLDVLGGAFSALQRAREEHEFNPRLREYGTVIYVGQGVVRVQGLPGTGSEEIVEFPGGRLGMAFNLDPEEIGVILLDSAQGLWAGAEVRRTGRALDVPVGDGLLGRVVDAVGRPLDGLGPVRASARLPVERPAPPITDRAPVTEPLETGLKVVDAMIPIGRGQRELILGDRQIGKTAIALDTILNQKGKDVLCIYCAIGQRSSAVSQIIAELRQRGAMDHCSVIVATGDDPPGLQFIAPYAAASMAEHFMAEGRDVLVVLDDLTHHARAYRELSLLLRRPPGREGFPGDIFYIHSRLLERSTHLREELGGGSVTMLPIIETEEQNMSAFIPTNLISITDGQIYLSPDLFQKGVLPAVDVGKSVSRVGGKTQLPAYRRVAGDLRLAYSQFVELEAFSRFGTRLDEATQRAIERGRRVRAVLQQLQYAPIPAPEQIAVLVAVNGGAFDEMPVEQVAAAEGHIRRAVRQSLPDLCAAIGRGEKLSDGDLDRILSTARSSLGKQTAGGPDGNG